METLHIILAMLIISEAMPLSDSAYSTGFLPAGNDIYTSVTQTVPHSTEEGAAVSDTLGAAVVGADRNRRTSAAVPLQVIDRKSIERRGMTQLHEAIKTLAGISVKDYGGIGGLKTVSVRNLGSQHTTVSYDGFAISDAQNGQVDISGFTLENMDEINAVTGPSDDIFQNARLICSCATINLKTKEVTQKLEAGAGLNAGCFGTWNPHIHIGGIIREKSSVRANASYTTSSGSYPFILENGIIQSREHRLNSDVKILNIETDFRHKTPKNFGTFSLKGTYTNSERGLPGPVILYSQNPTERLWDSRTGIYAKYNWQWGLGWRSETAVSYTRNRNRYLNEKPASLKSEDNNYLQQEAYASVWIGCIRGHWKFSAAEDLFANILDSDIPECPFPVRFNSMTAISAGYSGERLKITASVSGRYVNEWLRRDKNHGMFTKMNKGMDTDTPQPLFRVSPSVSASYAFLKDKSLIIRASVKEGYRVPTFNDLYYDRVGNTALAPEKALLSNLGITWSCYRKNIKFFGSIDVYLNSVRDKITAVPTMFIWKMRNIGKVIMTGADISGNISWTICRNVSLHADANYSYQYAIDVTDKDSKTWKQQIPYSPRHSGSMVISAVTHWITATYTLTGCGRRYSLPQNIRQNQTDPYTDQSISLGRTFNIRPISLNINIEALNLSGRNYEIIKGYPMPGRAFRITIKIRY